MRTDVVVIGGGIAGVATAWYLILAYVIAPGVVRTRMSEESAALTGGEAAVTATLPMGEWVPPEEVARVAAFLASGAARHLTGATIDLNGAAWIR